MAEQESAPNGFQVFLNNLLDFFGLCRPIDDSHENQRPGGETVSTQGFDRSTRSSEKPAGFQLSVASRDAAKERADVWRAPSPTRGDMMQMEGELYNTQGALEEARKENAELRRQMDGLMAEMFHQATSASIPEAQAAAARMIMTSADARAAAKQATRGSADVSEGSSFAPSPHPSSWKTNKSGSTSSPAPAGGTGRPVLEVTVCNASGLLGSGVKELFVAMKLGAERRVTPAKAPQDTPAQGGSIVTWDKAYTLPCHHHMPLRSSSLRVRLYTRNSLGIKSMLGESHIHLRALADSPTMSLSDSWPLSGVVGQVVMKLGYHADGNNQLQQKQQQL